jgi:hypothetical protein
MRRYYRQFLFMTCLAAACAPARADFLALPPSPDLTGDAGSVVGWGLGFESDDWSVLTFSEFLFQGSPAGVLGSYEDFIALPQNFYDQQSLVPLILGFDAAGGSGIGEFAIAPGLATGTVISGTVRLHYDTYFGDPVGGASLKTLDNTLDVPVTITVTGPTSDAPEPALGGILGFCLLLGVAKARAGYANTRAAISRGREHAG